MLVNPTSAGAYGMSNDYETGGDSEIDQTDFMQLLITQIQNQDPFDPLDNSEMVSQLNQFSMLDEMSTLNTKTDDMLLMSQSLNNTMMLDLVGRQVTVEGDQVQIDLKSHSDDEGNTVYETPDASRFSFSSASGGTATITLIDEAGVNRGTFTMAATAGLNEVDWESLISGNDADNFDGRYTVEVDLVSSNGVAVDTQTFMTLPVDSIRYENNIGVVEVGGSEFYVSQIYQVGV